MEERQSIFDLQNFELDEDMNDKLRVKWDKFIHDHQHQLTEEWLWQYRKPQSRVDSKLQKNLLRHINSKIKSQRELKKLIRSGVPSELRGIVWWACSGGSEKMRSAYLQNQSYKSYLDTAHAKQLPVLHEIEKDLFRTFPCNESYNSAEGLLPLRHLLYAYSERNPAIGYCQSMNFIGAVLLLYLSEEQAFWVLAAMIEDILPPNYYSVNMMGSRVDQLVFYSCLAWKLPKLYAHFKEHNMILEPVICPWFLCLYINTLPLSVVLRVWDCLLWEGDVVLHRIGLAICKLKEPRLLAANDFMELFQIMKEPLHAPGERPSEKVATPRLQAPYIINMIKQQLSQDSTADVVATAYDKFWLGSIPRAKIRVFRAEYQVVLETEAAEKEQRMQQLRLKHASTDDRASPDIDAANDLLEKHGLFDSCDDEKADLFRSSVVYTEAVLQRVLTTDIDSALELDLDSDATDTAVSSTDDISTTPPSTPTASPASSSTPAVYDTSYVPPVRRTSQVMMGLLQHSTNESPLTPQKRDDI